jgi:hypothetical protein
LPWSMKEKDSNNWQLQCIQVDNLWATSSLATFLWLK